MKTKTWNIGEYAKGGVITTELTDDKFVIIIRDWDFSKGSTKNSDQSNAPEINRCTIDLSLKDWNYNPYNKAYEFLTEETSHYYAEQILDWAGLKFHTHSTF